MSVAPTPSQALDRADELVHRFLGLRKGRDAVLCQRSPSYAAGRCNDVSDAFAAWVNRLGEDDVATILWAWSRKAPCGEDGYCRTSLTQPCRPGDCPVGHAVVAINGVVVDLTGTQFGSEEPLLTPLPAFRARWATVDPG